MSLFVVWLELEKLFEGPHGGLGFLPLELQRRELLRRGDELTVGLFALPLDPRRAQVREKFCALPIEQQQREELLGFAGAPAAVADASPACSELEWAEHEGLDAFRHRRRDRVRGRRRRGLQERREDPHVVGIELEVAESLPQRVRQRGTQQQEVTVALRRDGTQGASRRRGVVVQGHREKRGLRLEVERAESVRRSARSAARAN